MKATYKLHRKVAIRDGKFVEIVEEDPERENP